MCVSCSTTVACARQSTEFEELSVCGSREHILLHVRAAMHRDAPWQFPSQDSHVRRLTIVGVCSPVWVQNSCHFDAE